MNSRRHGRSNLSLKMRNWKSRRNGWRRRSSSWTARNSLVKRPPSTRPSPQGEGATHAASLANPAAGLAGQSFAKTEPAANSHLVQTLHRFLKKHPVRFFEDVRDAVGKWTLLQRRAQIVFAHLGGVFAGEPVFGLAEQVVAHLAPRGEFERLGVSPQA